LAYRKEVREASNFLKIFAIERKTYLKKDGYPRVTPVFDICLSVILKWSSFLI